MMNHVMEINKMIKNFVINHGDGGKAVILYDLEFFISNSIPPSYMTCISNDNKIIWMTYYTYTDTDDTNVISQIDNLKLHKLENCHQWSEEEWLIWSMTK